MVHTEAIKIRFMEFEISLGEGAVCILLQDLRSNEQTDGAYFF